MTTTTTEQPAATAPARTLPDDDAQMDRDRVRAIEMARVWGQHLIAAADTGDLDHLAHTVYMTICNLADDFTERGTITALTRWRRTDRKRIDAICRLGQSLRRDRPYPDNTAAVIASAE